jgi:hypothetical protein
LRIEVRVYKRGVGGLVPVQKAKLSSSFITTQEDEMSTPWYHLLYTVRSGFATQQILLALELCKHWFVFQISITAS